MSQKLEVDINPQYVVLFFQDFLALGALALILIAAQSITHIICNSRVYRRWMLLPDDHVIKATLTYAQGLIMGIALVYTNLTFPLRQFFPFMQHWWVTFSP